MWKLGRLSRAKAKQPTITQQKTSWGLEFKVIRSARRTFALQIRAGEVIVRAPFAVTKGAVGTFVSKHREWVEKHLKKSEETAKKRSREFKNGEKHSLLGQELTLRVVQAEKISVDYDNEYITISSPDISSVNIEILMYKLYFEVARGVIPSMFEKAEAEFFEKVNIKAKSVTIKRVKSYWGRCKSDRSISLNIELIRTPVEHINYVIYHELCHLKYMNHSKEFYKLLSDFGYTKDNAKFYI